MNYLIKPFSIICALIILTSCEEDEVVEKCQFTDPTYQFTTEQEQKRISFEYFEGQIIKYRSDNNEVLNFEVTEVDNCARGYYEVRGPGFFLGPKKPSHTFDSQIIRLSIIEHDTMEYSYRNKIHYYTTISSSTFRQAINFPLWNKNINSFALSGSQNPANMFFSEGSFTEIGNFRIGQHSFNEVVKFESGSVDINNQTFHLGNLLLSVNVLYYDQDFGIIRFDEVDGTIWEVEYPE